MNRKAKYFNFLGQLKDKGANQVVLEALAQGYKDIFEGKVGPYKPSYDDDPDDGVGFGELEEESMEDGPSEEDRLRDDIGTNMTIVDNYEDAGFKMPGNREPSPEEQTIVALCNQLTNKANSEYPIELIDVYRYIAAESFKSLMSRNIHSDEDMRNSLSDKDIDIIADVNPDDIINSIASRFIRTGVFKVVKIPIHFNTGYTVTFPALKIPTPYLSNGTNKYHPVYYYYSSKTFKELERVLYRAAEKNIVNKADADFIADMSAIIPQYFRDMPIFDDVALAAIKSIVKRNYKKLSPADLEWDLDTEDPEVPTYSGGEEAYTDFEENLANRA